MGHRDGLFSGVASAVLAAVGVLSAGGSAGSALGQMEKPEADQIWLGGKVHTCDPQRPTAEAIAVADGRILAVGTDEEIRKLAGKGTAVRNFRGGHVLPGLIDAHGDLLALGSFGLGVVDLSVALSSDDVVELVRQVHAKLDLDRWLIGGRWDSETWVDKELPRHQALSAVTANRPVWLRRADGRAGLANAKAMEVCGITRDTPDPPGGRIIRDENGEPTGVFLDAAMDLIVVNIRRTLHEADAMLLHAQQMCFNAGLTSVHQAGASPLELEAMKRVAESGKLKLRVYAMASGPGAMKWIAEHEPKSGDRLSVRAVEIAADGALLPRRAWLLEPYTDGAQTAEGEGFAGLNLTAPDELRSMVAAAAERGYQVCVSATGDRANRLALDVFEEAMKGKRPEKLRWRIEHAELVSEQDLARFGRLGVVASVQPVACASGMRSIVSRIGPERAKRVWAWKSLLDGGAILAAGSNFAVEPHDPFDGIHAAVTRQDVFGNPREGFHPEQRLTREQALRAYTLDAAYAAFEENHKGSITPGKLADFIVVDRDIMTCPEGDIPKTRVLLTIVGGETVARGGQDQAGK